MIFIYAVVEITFMPDFSRKPRGRRANPALFLVTIIGEKVNAQGKLAVYFLDVPTGPGVTFEGGAVGGLSLTQGVYK